ncbi:MAG: DUF4255 domain-containing protein [Syntrophomonadaceae bacterium]|nr:DUF4255 domain-containing protein [Syntrophomonadaceae bacterium]
MAGHTIIADVGAAICNLLRQEMVPDTIMNPDTIGLCNPADKGNIILGLHLYDIKESEEIRVNDMIDREPNKQQYPSTYLSLFYMMTAFSTVDVKFRAEENHRILGKAMQVLQDNAVFSAETLTPVEAARGTNLRIQMLNLDAEVKHRLWTFPNLPYSLTVFYKVSPIELESTRIRTVRRVVDMEISAKE